MPFIIHFPFLKPNGLTFFPFILLKEKQFKNNISLINHESIHLRQQMEMLIIPFYVVYFFHYLLNLVISGSHDIAYRNIVFEREAYDNANNPSYLESRRAYSFFKYL